MLQKVEYRRLLTTGSAKAMSTYVRFQILIDEKEKETRQYALLP